MGNSTIPRRWVLRSSAVVPAVLAGCVWAGDGSSNTYGYADGFEEGVTDWETDSDVPDDPNDPGNPVDWEIRRSTERAATGSASLRYYLDGRQDDGTIWIVRPFTFEGGRAYEVTMRADAWSASESFNTLAYLVMYAGRTRPTSEGSFPEPGGNSSDAGVTETGGLRETLNQTEGWMPYSFAWKTPTVETDMIYIAVGISAVWETEMTYFVDNIKLSAVPQ